MSIFYADSLRLLGAGHLQTNAGWRFAAHDHPYWEFIYFLRGCGSVNLPHATLRPHFSHLLIFPPALSHAESADPIDPEETIFISIEVSAKMPENAPLLLSDIGGDFRWICEHIFAEFSLQSPPTALALNYSRSLLLLIERRWSESPQKYDPVLMVQQYLNANYPHTITMEMLAGISHISPNYLTQLFRRQLGITPTAYLQSLRMDAARQLLLTSDISIKDIAARVGYNDHLYFRRHFKTLNQTTPSAYRAKLR